MKFDYINLIYFIITLIFSTPAWLILKKVTEKTRSLKFSVSRKEKIQQKIISQKSYTDKKINELQNEINRINRFHEIILKPEVSSRYYGELILFNGLLLTFFFSLSFFCTIFPSGKYSEILLSILFISDTKYTLDFISFFGTMTSVFFVLFSTLSLFMFLKVSDKVTFISNDKKREERLDQLKNEIIDIKRI
jgi:hypothetical protein